MKTILQNYSLFKPNFNSNATDSSHDKLSFDSEWDTLLFLGMCVCALGCVVAIGVLCYKQRRNSADQQDNERLHPLLTISM